LLQTGTAIIANVNAGRLVFRNCLFVHYNGNNATNREAIAGGKNLIHVIDQAKCIKCNTCFEVCPDRFAAVTKIAGAPVPPPVPEEKRSIARKGKEHVAG
jgi:Fe-S-cluster-containing hydrogenase component 2